MYHSTQTIVMIAMELSFLKLIVSEEEQEEQKGGLRN